MDTINFEQAIELFKLPRKLGQTAAGEEIVANVGRFGPYVKYGAKYVSLKTDDPYEVSLERALEVIKEKEIADANRLIMDFPDAGIQVLNGRYGPYITDKQKNAKIPKDRDPKSLTLEECQALLAAAPVRTFGKWGRKKAANAPAAKKAAGKGKKGATEAAPETAPVAAPVRAAAKKTATRLAAKGKQAAVDKKAPGSAPPRPKAKPKAKKSAAKQKS